MADQRLQESERHLTIPVSICRVCDKDRDPLDVPDEPCGHDPETHRGMVPVEVVPLAVAEALAEALEAIADGHERHNPGWWIKGAKRALAGYRGKYPKGTKT